MFRGDKEIFGYIYIPRNIGYDIFKINDQGGYWNKFDKEIFVKSQEAKYEEELKASEKGKDPVMIHVLTTEIEVQKMMENNDKTIYLELPRKYCRWMNKNAFIYIEKRFYQRIVDIYRRNLSKDVIEKSFLAFVESTMKTSTATATTSEEAASKISKVDKIAEISKRIEADRLRAAEDARQKSAEDLKKKNENDSMLVKRFFQIGVEKARMDFEKNIVSLENNYYFLSDGSSNGEFAIIHARNAVIKIKGSIPNSVIFLQSNEYLIERNENSAWIGNVTYIFNEHRVKAIPKKFIDSKKTKFNGKVYFVDGSKKIYKYLNVLPWSNWKVATNESDMIQISFSFSEKDGLWSSIGFDKISLSKVGIMVDKLSLQ